MAKTPDILTGLVGLKRQHAEQRVAKVQNEISDLDKEINLAREALTRLDENDRGEVGADFRQRSAIIQGALHKIKRLSASREGLEAELAQARSAFQNAIYSEGQLEEMQAIKGKKN